MTDLNTIKSFPSSEEAYIVLEQESGDFQEVHSSIGHALIADLKTVTVKLIENNSTLEIECGDSNVFLNMDEVRELADRNGEKIMFAVQVFIKQHIPDLNKESVAALVKGIGMRKAVHVIHAGFSF
jgi:hypothetical protein